MMFYENNSSENGYKNPFNRNLIKNHSGQKGLKYDWNIILNEGDGWIVESPPVGVTPLPGDPIFEGLSHCFATSFVCSWKEQMIYLIQEGISEYVLDHMQPTVKISEWYCCRWDSPALYSNEVVLISESDEILEFHQFTKELRDADQNKWFKFEYEFKNYGKGLRKISFGHGGQDKKFWRRHYGSKMAGACVVIEQPYHNNPGKI